MAGSTVLKLHGCTSARAAIHAFQIGVDFHGVLCPALQRRFG
jgi:hypothetical protein